MLDPNNPVHVRDVVKHILENLGQIPEKLARNILEYDFKKADLLRINSLFTSWFEKSFSENAETILSALQGAGYPFVSARQVFHEIQGVEWRCKLLDIVMGAALYP